jgi:hypothetical protein
VWVISVHLKAALLAVSGATEWNFSAVEARWRREVSSDLHCDFDSYDKLPESAFL